MGATPCSFLLPAPNSSSSHGGAQIFFFSASLFIFLPTSFPPLLLLAHSSFSLVWQQGAPTRTAAAASKYLRSDAGPKKNCSPVTPLASSLLALRACHVFGDLSK
jgi:hypothetical protein